MNQEMCQTWLKQQKKAKGEQGGKTSLWTTCETSRVK